MNPAAELHSMSEAPMAVVSSGCCEQALLLTSGGEQLVGIVSLPADDQNAVASSSGLSDLAVVVVVGGPQYRAGSHRLFVQLCRHLAANGVVALRFDVRGMGDSEGAQRNFEQLGDDIATAIDGLQRHRPGICRIVLWGLCDGASASLLYCHERGDPRVAGLCLLNPWARSEATLARTHVKHYYLQRMKEPAFWRKLFSGQVAGKAARELWRNIRLANTADKPAAVSLGRLSQAREKAVAAEMQLSYIERMALGLQRSAVPTWLLLSSLDITAHEFDDVSRSHPAWVRALRQRDGLCVQRLEGADHTLSSEASALQLMHDCTAWLQRSMGADTSAPLTSLKAAS